jgi:GNAT superfamily N-acetyltransferase
VESVVIREAELRDVQRLVELMESGSLGVHQELPTVDLAYQRALTEILETDGNDVLVAVSGGALVGMCQLVIFRHLQSNGGLCAEIESMHVHPDFRSQGIGGQLLEAAVKRAERSGCYRVQLTSNKQRHDAHRFYVREGFDPSHVGFKRVLPKH